MVLVENTRALNIQTLTVDLVDQKLTFAEIVSKWMFDD